MTSFCVAWALATGIPAIPSAVAVDATRTAVLVPTLGDPTLEAFGGAVERLLRKEVDELDDVDTSATPALDLDGLQLAVGCVAENDDCLRDVAAQLGADVLLATHLDPAGEGLVISILRFDARSASPRRQAVRQAQGPQRENDLLSALPDMVAELYGRPRIEAPPPAVVATPLAPAPAPIWPWALLGTGGAALIAGAVVGVVSNGTEADFAAAPTQTRAQVDAALALRSDAEDQSLIGNLCLGAGLALAVSGAVALWWTWPAPAPLPAVSAGPNGALVFGLRLPLGAAP